MHCYDINTKILKLEARKKRLENRLNFIEDQIYQLKATLGVELDVDLNGPGLYVLQCHEIYKIGYANDLSSRLSVLQIGNPYDIRIVQFIPCASIEDAANLEKTIHGRYTDKHVRGEWFRLSSKDLIDIANLKNKCSYDRLFSLISEKNLFCKPFRSINELVEKDIKIIISEISLNQGGSAAAELVVQEALKKDIPKEVTSQILERMRRDGDVFEPRPGVLKLP